MTQVQAKVTRSDGRGPTLRLRFLVDTGALYTVLPARVWRALGLEPSATEDFDLADGTSVARGISECRFEIGGRTATSPVVLASATTPRYSAR